MYKQNYKIDNYVEKIIKGELIMKIDVLVKYEYNIAEEEIERMKSKILENIQNDFEDEDDINKITINDISIDIIKEYLSSELPEYIKESKNGYDSGYSGVVCDDYFNTITLNYYEEDVNELISNLSEKIYNNFKEEK